MNYDNNTLPESHGINMLTIIIYFLLFAFWLDKCVGFELEKLFGLTMGLSLPNIGLYLLIIAWALKLMNRDIFIQKYNLNYYMFLIMIFMIISIFGNVMGYGVQTTSLKKEIVSFKYFITPWLLFFLITTLIRDRSTCERLISGLILLLLASVFAVLIQNYLGIDLGTRKNIQAYIGRSAGFSEANQYAAFLVLFLPLLLSFMFFQEDLSKKIKAFFLLLLGMVGLASAISKGGFIAFFFSIGYFFYIAYRDRMIGITRVLLSLFLLVSLGVSSFFLLPSQTKEVAKARITLEEEPFNPWASHQKTLAEKITSGRTVIWMYSLDLIVQRPILGYGHAACENQLNLSTHSDPIEWLVNYGIIGFFLFAMIYIKIYRHVTHYLKRSADPHSQILYLSYICGFVGYVVAMSGVNLNEPRYIFWIYTAIIYKYADLDTVTDSKVGLESSVATTQMNTTRSKLHNG